MAILICPRPDAGCFDPRLSLSDTSMIINAENILLYKHMINKYMYIVQHSFW